MNASFFQEISWLWVPVTVLAAFAQTVRNTAQRSLTEALGTWPATLARFLYGLPFAAVFLGALYVLPQDTPELPELTGAYWAWIALGAFFQVAATAALLIAMKTRNFAVAVTLSKTEVLQIALFSSLFLHELPAPVALLAMVIATAGILLLSMPAGGLRGSLAAWTGRSAGMGVLCGACFALATVGYRGAAIELDADSPWLSAGWGVLLAQVLQTVGLGLWLQLRTPEGLGPLLRAWRVSLLAGSMGAAASLAWFSAYAMQTAGPVRTVGMVEVVFSYLVSRRLFSESISRNEQWGMALVVAGLVLICWWGV